MTVNFCKFCRGEHDFCDCCGIGIGLKHKEESYPTKVGNCVLCSQCYERLKRSGRIEVEFYLYSDGVVTLDVVKREPKKEKYHGNGNQDNPDCS